MIGEALIAWRDWEEGMAEARARGLPVLVSADPDWTTAGQRLDLVAGRDDRLGRAFCGGCVAVRVDPFRDPDRAGRVMDWSQRLSGRRGPPTLVLLSPSGVPLVAYPDLAYEGREGAVPSLAALIDSARDLPEAGDPDMAPGTGPGPADDLLLDPERLGQRLAEAGADTAAREGLRRDLGRILSGGVRDHVGGGFHRAARDETWTVPHFEKTLLENARMAAFLSRAGALLADPELSRIAGETATFVEEVLDTDPHAKAVVADSHFYTWTPREFAAVVPRAVAKSAALRFHMTQADVPHVLIESRSLEEVAAYGHVPAAKVQADIEAALRALRLARKRRPQPAVVSVPCGSTEQAISEALRQVRPGVDRRNTRERALKPA
ncbi:hypothetical protein [Roseicyclus sp.]|uniref:hypothetical protein n=1 Tax=Roseicyclus sp. TaxID=1914329 RepID=UPI003F9FE67D